MTAKQAAAILGAKGGSANTAAQAESRRANGLARRGRYKAGVGAATLYKRAQREAARGNNRGAAVMREVARCEAELERTERNST